MPDYNLTIHLTGNSPMMISKKVNYSAEYQLNADVVNIGVRGITQKIGDTHEYFPPHRISKIDIELIKP